MNQVELLRHVADNLEAGRLAGFGLQFNQRDSAAGNIMAIQWHNYEIYTLAPRTHDVNGFIVLAPMSVEPAAGVVCYTASTSSGDLTSPLLWTGSAYCLLVLARKVLFSTKEAAQQNALAMIGRNPDFGVEGV
tara:strand:- start:14909 stop:15307 length:399 start_codon:yes stop_codon:yes gene_type:complete